MIYALIVVYVLMGLPNGALVVYQSTEFQRATIPRMIIRVMLGIISILIWPITALKVYYQDMYKYWRAM